MTKYEELSKLACDQTERTFKIKEECREVARRIVFGYKKYLDVPEANFSTVEIGKDLDTHKINGIDFRVHLTQRDDGLWWFGIYIHYETNGSNAFLKETLKIGIIPEGDKFRIRMEDDTLIDATSESDLEVLFEKMYAFDKKEFTKDTSSYKNKIGFIQ